MPVEFEKAWTDLNARLHALESSAGLNEALKALEAQQRESGFITDRLQALERHTFRHPRDPSRWFGVQYNPRRALRFKGAGGQAKPKPAASRNDGCLLCRENIAWQQRGVQLGYQLDVGARAYLALMNPFPLLPTHVVIAASEHRTQEWAFAPGGGFAIRELVNDLVCIVDRMPGHIGFYNGVSAGASIPGHLHYQFVMRPEHGGPFPLEASSLKPGVRDDGPAFTADYPLDAAVWTGRAGEVAARAGDWLASWGERNRARLPGLSGNLVVTKEMDAAGLTLFFVPRDRTRSRPDGFSGLVGGLETLGEIVLSSEQEKGRLDAGEIDYFTLEAALASVHTPLEVD